MSEENQKTNSLLSYTAEIVASHVANNPVPLVELPGLMEQVFATLRKLSGSEKSDEALPEPAVAIRKSVTPDYIICLEDGKKLKMLKRHLKAAYDMTPDEYRARWGLPRDYPMVAPNYAQQRRELAKRIGLGKNR